MTNGFDWPFLQRCVAAGLLKVLDAVKGKGTITVARPVLVYGQGRKSG